MTGGTPVDSSSNIDLLLGTVTSGNALIESVGTLWYRVTLTTTGNGTNTTTQVNISGGSSGETGQALLWGAQFEELPFVSSYIPTTTTAVTRAADDVICQGLNNTANLGGAMSVSYKVKSLGNTGNFGFIYAIGAIGASDYLSFSTAFSTNNGEDKLTLYSGGAPDNNVIVGGECIYSDSNIF